MQKKSKAIIFAKRLAQTSRVVPLDGYNRKIEFEDEDGPPASWAQMGITMKASSSQSEIIFNDIHTHALKQGQPPADIWINDGEDGKYDSDSLGEQESGGEEDDQDNESKSNWSAPSPPRDHESQEATPPASHRKLPLPYRSSDNSSIGSAQRGELNWSPRSAQFVGSFEFTAGGQRASQDRLRPAGTSLGALLRSVGGLRSALQHVVQENNTLADLAVPESLKAGPPLLEKFAGWAFGATARSVPLAALAGLACVSVGGVGAALSTFAGCSALADDLLGLPSGDPGFPVLRGAVISSVVVALSGVGLQLLHGWISHAFVHQSRNCGAHGRLTCCGLTGSQDDFSHEDNSGLIWDSEGGEPNSSGSSSKKKRCSPLKCCGMGRRLQQLALWSLTARGRLLEALVAVVLAFVGLLLVGRLALGLAAGLIGVSAAQLACANLEAAANTAASSDDDGVPAAFYDTVVTAFANSGIGAALDALELEAGHDWTPLWLPVDSNQNLGSGASAQFASKLEAYTSGGVRNDDGQIYGFTAEAAALSLGDMCGSLEGARDHWRHALGYCLVFLVGQAVVLYRSARRIRMRRVRSQLATSITCYLYPLCTLCVFFAPADCANTDLHGICSHVDYVPLTSFTPSCHLFGLAARAPLAAACLRKCVWLVKLRLP